MPSTNPKQRDIARLRKLIDVQSETGRGRTGNPQTGRRNCRELFRRYDSRRNRQLIRKFIYHWLECGDQEVKVATETFLNELQAIWDQPHLAQFEQQPADERFDSQVPLLKSKTPPVGAVSKAPDSDTGIWYWLDIKNQVLGIVEN